TASSCSRDLANQPPAISNDIMPIPSCSPPRLLRLRSQPAPELRDQRRPAVDTRPPQDLGHVQLDRALGAAQLCSNRLVVISLDPCAEAPPPPGVPSPRASPPLPIAWRAPQVRRVARQNSGQVLRPSSDVSNRRAIPGLPREGCLAATVPTYASRSWREPVPP